MSAETLCIGSELVAGRIADTNATYLADQLLRLGFRVVRHTTVGDRKADIIAALDEISRRAKVAVVTGGLGPTPDDLTRNAFSEFCDAPLVENAEAAMRTRSFFAARNREPSPSNLVQAQLPEGAELIRNPRGTAAGFSIRHGTCEFFCLPGVPGEMKMMYHETVKPRLRGMTAQTILVRCLQVFGVPESVVGERLSDLMLPVRNPEMATQARQGVITLRITSTGTDEAEAREQLDSSEKAVRDRLGDAVFSSEERSLAEVVVGLLERRGVTLAVAESCTGGEISAALTDVPGISRFFLEAAVTYSNESKSKRLAVPLELIRRHGAVSREVAAAMARGVRTSSGANIGVATTGIAGPTGATPTKPVGLVYVALAHAEDVSVEELRLAGDRQQIKDRAAKYALNKLRLHLERREIHHG